MLLSLYVVHHDIIVTMADNKIDVIITVTAASIIAVSFMSIIVDAAAAAEGEHPHLHAVVLPSLLQPLPYRLHRHRCRKHGPPFTRNSIVALAVIVTLIATPLTITIAVTTTIVDATADVAAMPLAVAITAAVVADAATIVSFPVIDIIAVTVAAAMAVVAVVMVIIAIIVVTTVAVAVVNMSCRITGLAFPIWRHYSRPPRSSTLGVRADPRVEREDVPGRPKPQCHLPRLQLRQVALPPLRNHAFLGCRLVAPHTPGRS
jgi:hypothetical protein